MKFNPSPSAKSPQEIPTLEIPQDMKLYIEKIYDDHPALNMDIVVLISILESFFRHIDREIISEDQIEKIREDIAHCKVIKDREKFLQQIFNCLQPLIVLRSMYPKQFEKAQSAANNEDQGYVELNRLVTYEKIGNIIHLHHSQAKTIGPDRNLYTEAMRKLAHIVFNDKAIQSIEANSWIVSKAPKLFELNGFSVQKTGRRDDEGREEGFAVISRQQFLDRFLDTK
jgi:hypothetical protein